MPRARRPSPVADAPAVAPNGPASAAEAARRRVDAWVEATADDSMALPPRSWTVDDWWALVRHHPDLRVMAAYTPWLPEVVVRALATDRSWRVRSFVAQKRNLPPDLFPVLARDRDEAVRQRVACNAKAPDAIVEALTHDPAAHVARVAAYQLRERRKQTAPAAPASPS